MAQIHLESIYLEKFELRGILFLDFLGSMRGMLLAAEWTYHLLTLAPSGANCFSQRMANSMVLFFEFLAVFSLFQNLFIFSGQLLHLPVGICDKELFPAISMQYFGDKIEAIFDENAFKYNLHKHLLEH